MAYFSEDFLDRRRKQWLRSIVYVEGQVNGVWYRGNIDNKYIEGKNIVIMATFPSLNASTCTVTASRLIDVRGETAAYQQRVVQKQSGQGIMLKITIPIYEVSI